MDTIISILITLLASVVFAVVATVLGCLLAGLDRKVTARMQGRVGPPLLQPYYDVRKLFSKENTAVNTAMEAIDKVRDTSTSHERCSIIEVMGRGAGWLALWCGIANGAEDVLIPEKYDYDEQKLINNIIESRKMGKKHHIIINAEGIGHSQAMAMRIEAATGIETRATILGHMQRGGSPTCKDRVYASMMGAMAVDLLLEGKKSRVVGYRHGDFVDFDINEALAMEKSVTPYMWEVCESLSHNYKK